MDRLIREIEQESKQRKENEEILRLHTATVFNTLAYDNSEPRAFREALDSPQRDEWINGIRSELKSLYTNQTWDIMPIATQGNTIDSKSVFKIKTNPDNSTIQGKTGRQRISLNQGHKLWRNICTS